MTKMLYQTVVQVSTGSGVTGIQGSFVTVMWSVDHLTGYILIIKREGDDCTRALVTPVHVVILVFCTNCVLHVV